MDNGTKIQLPMPVRRTSKLRFQFFQILCLALLLFNSCLPASAGKNSMRLKRPADSNNGLKMQTPTIEPTNPTGQFDLRLRKSVVEDGVGEGVIESGTAANTAVPNVTIRLEGGVTQTFTSIEVQKFAKYDVTLLLDRSFSMTGQDCPPFNSLTPRGFNVGVSRWDWCREQTKPLASLAGKIRNKGLTITTFYTTFKTFKNVTVGQVERLYAEQSPNQEVGTCLNLALQDALENYFARRDAASAANPVNPLAIAIVSDGKVHRTSDIEYTLLNATKRMRYPGEIQVTLLLVGERSAPKKSRGMLFLDDTLRRYGAKYDIVKIIPFPVLEQIGLSRALIQALPD